MAAPLALFLLVGTALASDVDINANPIRKVVNLMETMQSKIEAEGKKNDELFEKFECYCKKTQTELEDEIAKADAIGNVKPEDIKAKEAQLQQLQQAVDDLKNEETEEEKTLAAATASREKQHQEHMTAETEHAGTESAAEGALKTLHTNQTDADDLSAHEAVASPAVPAGFLQVRSKQLPGEVNSYIRQIEETSEENWRQEVADDAKGAGLFESVKSSKTKSIKTVLDMVTKKHKKIGDLKVEIVNMKHMMSGGAEALAENKKMLAELRKDCAQRASEQDEKKALRADELKALEDTIKLLNDDDALDLFRKTIKAPSLLQFNTAHEQAREKAKQIVSDLRALVGSHPELNFISLALSGKNVDFTKVFKKIDGMVALLGKEGTDDASKKDYCNNEFNDAADKAKDLKSKISGLSASVKEKQASIEKIVEEIKSINEGVRSLDESMAQATENRKAESAAYQELVQQDSAAVELLGVAKNRLHKFYNPQLFKDTTTPSPYDPYALVQVSLHQKQAEAVKVGAAPATAGAYKRSTGASNGVLSMIATMISDLEKEMAVAKADEKNSQAEYESTVADAKEKRVVDLKDAQGKAAAKAEYEGDYSEDEQTKSMTLKAQQAAMRFTENLHKQCDWLLKNFDLRQSAREEEVEGLKRAKAVLAGADYSLLQVTPVRRLRGN